MENLKKTPLCEDHKRLKAKMVSFGGWLMPVSYESVLLEHHHVRQKAGVFDVSHMGEIFVEGKEATKFLQFYLMNDVAKLNVGSGQYSALINAEGGIIDDLIVYKIAEEKYLCCVNASNIEKDFAWMESQSKAFSVTVKNDSKEWGQIAFQGPKSKEIAQEIFHDERFASLSYMKTFWLSTADGDVLVARTGYTGEVGFEFYVKGESATQSLWRKLLSHADIKPIGLGARDTLRLEACYVLYGNEINDHVSPFEGGISWALKLEKEMISKAILQKQKQTGAKRKLLAFKMVDEGIPRSHMEIFSTADQKLGEVTSGSVLPSVGGAGGLALVEADSVATGAEIFVSIRGQKRKAIVVEKPLYQPKIKS